jgi:hypothetical protein
MTNVTIDIETIPDQRPEAKERFIKESVENFKAPSGMTKTLALEELGIDPKGEGKFMAKDVAISEWEKHFAPIKAEEVGIENWRKTGLDGAQGELFSVAWAVGDGGIYGMYRALSGCEKIFLEGVFAAIKESVGRHSPFFIGQFVAGFDLKFLFRRAVILGVEPPFKLPFAGRHGNDFYDLQQAWEGYNGKCSLDTMCKALGIEGKPGDIDGSKVWDFVEAGEYEKVMEYNKYDVEQTRKVYRRFNFLD